MKLGKFTISVFVLVLIAILFLIARSGISFWGDRGVVEETPRAEERVTEETPSDPDRFPVIEGGLSSWKEVLAQAEKDVGFLGFLNKMTGLTIEEIRLLAKLEAEGYDYSVSLPKGTDIINSGRKEGVFFEKEGPLERDRAALTELKGTPVILVSCGNPIRFKPQPKPEQVAQPKPEPPPQPKPTVVQEPVLRTDNVPLVTQTSGQLAGFVDPKGEAVVAWFEYGQGDSLDRRTPEFSVPSPGGFLRTVSGLHPETRYSFRIVARNSAGTFHGKTRTFMTDIVVAIPASQPEPPPQPKPTVVQEPVLRTDNATNITGNSAHLNGYVDTKGEMLDLWFEWGTGSSLVNSTFKTYTGSSQSLTRQLTGLVEGTTYHYRIVARDKTGKTYHGGTRSFRTDITTSEPEPPPVVAQEPILRTDNVPSVTSTSAELAGFIDPKGMSGHYWFEYGEGDSLDRRTSESSISSQRNVISTVSGLHVARKYSFRVVVRIDGRTFYGNQRSFTTDF